MNSVSMLRRHSLSISIILVLGVYVGNVLAANKYEPPGFVAPPNLLNAMQQAKEKSSLLAVPPAEIVLPTPGAQNTTFQSPWVVETEFGNSRPVNTTSLSALEERTGDEASFDGASVKESALQGGTTMMLSGLPTAVGRIPATYDVSPTGAANYTIPIWTPPGARGIEPNLALVYSSRTPDSLMGPGWSISGLSTIMRCNKTWVQDGAPAPITLTTSDKFCLDGNRLRLTGGTYGSAGSTYQTELEVFSKVTANGTSGGGPQWFEVKGKDGLIYEYGNTADSRIAGVGNTTPYLWALNKVRDRQGNNMTISYTLSNGTFRPNTISYTQTPATNTAYNYTVVFGYTARAAATNLNAYVADGSIQQTVVLTSIDVRHLGSTVRIYNIDYSTGPTTQWPRISAVQACTTTDCLKPTTISYQDGQIGVANPTVATGVTAIYGYTKAADIDGDGRDDLIYAVNGGTTQNWYVKFSTASGFGSPVFTGAATSSADDVLLDDFLGKGTTDLLAPSGGIWFHYRWNGSTFSPSSTGLTVDPNKLVGIVPTDGRNPSFAPADINGDGLPDLAWAADIGGVRGIYTRLNTSNGSTLSFSASSTLGYQFPTSNSFSGIFGNNSYAGSAVRHIDFNGDRRDDVVYLTWSGSGLNITGQWHKLLSQGSTFSAGVVLSNLYGSGNVLDLNNDSCTDLFYRSEISISACNGSSGGVLTVTAGGYALDWDGDGRDDLVTIQSWYRSQGDSVAAAASTGLPGQTGYCFVFDQNGDGLDDLGCVDYSTNVMTYGLHNGAGVMPDLATSIIDGYEMSVAFSYKPITAVGSGSCYVRDSAAPTFPNRIFMGPLYAACTMTASDGTGSTYQVAHSYYNANSHLQGRGFLGFERHYSVDNRNGILHMDSHRQTFPHIGWVAHSLVRQPNGTTFIREINRTLSSLSFGSGSETRSFPYISASADDAYEVGGTLNGQWITRTTTNTTLDSYGNPTSVTVATTDKSPATAFYNDTYTVQTVNTISNDSTNWCLGRPSQTAVASTLPDATSQTRTTDFTVDYANCRTTQEVIEPSSSTLKVTTTYGFDSCGNISSVSVVGKNPVGTDLPTRTTGSSYGTRCQLPESVTNALNQTSTTVYDYNLGLASSATDPNGITSSWIYDGYGRNARENRADGTYTTWSRAICDSSNGYCGLSIFRTFVTTIDYATTGSQIRYSYAFHDGFDRLRYDEPQNLSGGVTYSVSVYDALGRKSLQYVPVTTGSWHARIFGYDLLNRPTGDNLYQAGVGTYSSRTIGYEGRKTIFTDGEGNITYQYADVRGQLRQITHPSPGSTSYYTWDHFGNLKTTTDGIGAGSTFDYNIRGFKTGSTDADAGNWTSVPNSFGEVTSQTDAKGQTTTFTYDTLGRQTSRTEVEGASAWNWGTSAAAKNIGRLASISGPGYYETYAYDSISRLSQAMVYTGTADYYDYAYNSSTGFLDNITYPTSTSGYRLRAQYLYQYGTLNQVRDYNAPSTVWWQLNAEDARGNPIDEQFANGVHVIANNDDLTGHLNYRTSGNNGSYNNHQNITYQWDKNENLTHRIDVNQSSLTERFYYDALDRLDYSTLNGTTNLDMAFDAGGNITSKTSSTDPAQNVGSYTYHATKKHAVTAAGSNSYTYDANGNMATRNGVTTSWYSYNLPNTISNGTYASQFFYGPNRNRWKQQATYSNGTENTIYIGGLMEKTTVPAGTAYRHYIPAGGNKIVYTRWSTGTNLTYYVTSDHLGSSTAITDSTGAIVVKENFGAYGARRGSSWTGAPSSGDWSSIASATRQGFTGHEALDNLNLIHMNGRVFDPVIGRFTSADPYIDWGMGSQGLNRFSYVGNRALRYTDPTGFDGFVLIPCVDCANEVVVTGRYSGRDLNSGDISFSNGSTGNEGTGSVTTVTVTGTPTKKPAPVPPPPITTYAMPYMFGGTVVQLQNPIVEVLVRGKQKPSCPKPGPSATASQFVLGGAAGGAALGSVIVSQAIITSGVSMIGAELAASGVAAGLVGALGVVDVVGNGVMAGIGLGGPYGAVVGGVVGLGLYGAYKFSVSNASNKPSC